MHRNVSYEPNSLLKLTPHCSEYTENRHEKQMHIAMYAQLFNDSE